MLQRQSISSTTMSCLITEKFHGLSGELAKWRLSPEINLMDARRDKGRILGFVKGLRFSARIAYLARDIVSSAGLEVNWGHLVNAEGTSCSAECDVIIHKPGYLQKWNGGERPIMDFRFIESSQAIAVISCKSNTKAIDKDYCSELKAFGVRNIFLFSECCAPASIKRLTRQAQERGYSGFFHLYTITKGADTFAVNEAGILEFIKVIRDLS